MSSASSDRASGGGGSGDNVAQDERHDQGLQPFLKRPLPFSGHAADNPTPKKRVVLSNDTSLSGPSIRETSSVTSFPAQPQHQQLPLSFDGAPAPIGVLGGTPASPAVPMPPFLPPNPFMAMDPGLMNMMMSNPAVAMAGYAAMAAAAQNLAQQQQQQQQAAVARVLNSPPHPMASPIPALPTNTETLTSTIKGTEAITTEQSAPTLGPLIMPTQRTVPAPVSSNSNASNSVGSGPKSLSGAASQSMSSASAADTTATSSLSASSAMAQQHVHHHEPSQAPLPATSQFMPPFQPLSVNSNPVSVGVWAPQPTQIPTAPPRPLPVPIMPRDIHTWNLEKLEKHIAMIQEHNHQVPQALAILLSDARRREDRRAAKRVANRKSASTSRARKKAFVEEMARTNARLKRQAMILSLLPDLVIAVNSDGVITFCSAQVERALGHRCDDLVGANIVDIMVPASRDTIRRLIQTLIGMAEAKGNGSDSQESTKGKNQRNEFNSNGNGNSTSLSSGAGGDLSSNAASAAAVISELSISNDGKNKEKPFPLSVVNVKSKWTQSHNENDNARLGESQNGDVGMAQSSSVNTSLSRSASSFGSRSNSNNPSSSDDSGVDAPAGASDEPRHKTGQTAPPSSKPPKKAVKDCCESSSSPYLASDSKQQCASPPSDGSSYSAEGERQSEPLKRKVKLHHAKFSKAFLADKDDVADSTVPHKNAESRQSSSHHWPNVHPPREEDGESPKMIGKHNKKVIQKEMSSGSASSLTYESLLKHSSYCNNGNSDSFLSDKPTGERLSSSSGGEDRRTQAVKRAESAVGNSSEDSGYGEGSDSFPSPEDTSSSTDESCGHGRRPRPLAPACNICLIRDDLTTIWCEVTSSMKTRSLSEFSDDCDGETEMGGGCDSGKLNASLPSPAATPGNANNTSAKSSDDEEPKKLTKEFLMCLRPIRDGAERVDGALRFRPVKDEVVPETLEDQATARTDMLSRQVSSATGGKKAHSVTATSDSTSDGPTQGSSGDSSIAGKNVVEFAQKRHVSGKRGGSPIKKAKGESNNAADDSEISVVESLILMSSKKGALG